MASGALSSLTSTFEKLQGSNETLFRTILGLKEDQETNETPLDVASAKAGNPPFDEKLKEVDDVDLEAQKKRESDASIAFIHESPNSWSLMVLLYNSLANLLLGVSVILFVWLPVELMSICFAVYMISKTLISAIYHAVLSIVLGRILLDKTRRPVWHSSSLPAASVGAVGGTMVVLCGSLAAIVGRRLFCHKQAARFTKRRSWLFAFVIRIFTSALAGVFGSAVLLLAEVDIKDLDVLHSAFYGAAGGAYLSICMLVTSKTAKAIGWRQQSRMKGEPRAQ